MRYKLIKKYPYSPEINTIVYPHNEEEDLYYEHEEYLLDSCEVENYPEFWQPESEWIVMSKRINSELGSSHWLNTLLGRISRIGEHLKYHSKNDLHQKYGELIQDDIKEVLEYFKDKLK